MSESSENNLGSDSDAEPVKVAKDKPVSSRPALFLSSSSEDSSEGEGEGVNDTAVPPTPNSSQNMELMIELEMSSDEEDKEQKTDNVIESTKESSRLFSSDDDSINSPHYTDSEPGDAHAATHTAHNSTSQALFGEELSSSSSSSSSADEASSNNGSHAEISGVKNREQQGIESTGESEGIGSGEEGSARKQQVLEEQVVDDHDDEFLDGVGGAEGGSDVPDEAAGFLSDDDDLLGAGSPRDTGSTLSAQMPRSSLEMGSGMFYVKLPNFLSIDTRPFNPAFYEYEGEDDDILDEEGRKRLKLKVENTIRWRKAKDKEGQDIRESNARLVKWKNGAMSLYLGNEIFDVSELKMEDRCNHLYLIQNAFLQAQSVFNKKLNIKPSSTDSQTHRKITLSIADRVSRAQKMRIIPAAGENPEVRRAVLQKKEEDRAKVEKQRVASERARKRKLLSSGQKLTRRYLEDNDDLSDDTTSVNAVKRKLQRVKRSAKNRRKASIDDFVVDSDDKESNKGTGSEHEDQLSTSSVEEKEDSFESDTSQVGTRKRQNSLKSDSGVKKAKVLDESESSLDLDLSS